MEQRVDDDHLHFVLDIDEKLGNLSSIPTIPLERSIFRVHDALRNINVKAYEPQVIAIGPYHHAKYEEKAHLRPMEEHKLLYLKQLLQRRNETSAERYFVALQKSEERARKFYAEPISLSSNGFVEMMLLDGCFIIEFLRKNMKHYLRMDNDPIFQLNHIQLGLKRDLQLFENQLPLFVLLQLFDITKLEESENIIELALYCFENIVQPGQHTTNIGVENIEKFPHLLSLMHNYFCYPFKELLSQRNININVGGQEGKNGRFIESVTKLKEAGVEFHKADQGRSLFDITFQNGKMDIPTLVVSVRTDSLFRNYIAYEQYLPPYDGYPKYFTNYRSFIDCLLNSSKDVEILCRLGIVHNHLGDHEVVSSMVHKLGDNVTVNLDSFDACYSKVFNDVYQHCRRRKNKWLAKLRRDYFAAATVLLLLTVIQTIFSILSVVLPIAS